jgi:uncharacterized protein YukE
MGYKVTVDTDYILGISKNINDTSSEISNSINSLQKICDDLGSNLSDRNMQNFKNNFSTYLASLKDIIPFYTEVSSTINDLVKEYDNTDNNNAGELRKSIVNNEEGVE